MYIVVQTGLFTWAVSRLDDSGCQCVHSVYSSEAIAEGIARVLNRALQAKRVGGGV